MVLKGNKHKTRAKKRVFVSKKKLIEAIMALNYYCMDLNSSLKNGDLTSKEKQSIRKNINANYAIKHYAIDQMYRDGILFFECFSVQVNEPKNQRYLFSQFTTKDGSFVVKKPAKVDDLIAMQASFKVEHKETSDFTKDYIPDLELNDARNILAGYIQKDIRLIFGHKNEEAKAFNAFNCEPLRDENGNLTPEFPEVQAELKKYNEKSEQKTDEKKSVFDALNKAQKGKNVIKKVKFKKRR